MPSRVFLGQEEERDSRWEGEGETALPVQWGGEREREGRDRLNSTCYVRVC